MKAVDSEIKKRFLEYAINMLQNLKFFKTKN